MVFLRRKVRLNEDGVFSDLGIIKNAELLQNLKIRAKQEFDKKMAALKAEYDKKLQDYEIKYSQLLAQQYNITKSEKAQQQTQTTTNSSTNTAANNTVTAKTPSTTANATTPTQTNMTTANKAAANQAIVNQAIAGKKNESVNEGVNGKHLLLQDIIMQCVRSLDLSYSLDMNTASTV